MWVFPMVELLVLPRFTDGKTEAWRGSVSQNQACGSQATVAPGGWGEESRRMGAGAGAGAGGEGQGGDSIPGPCPAACWWGGQCCRSRSSQGRHVQPGQGSQSSTSGPRPEPSGRPSWSLPLASLEGVNTVPLSFRTNTTMLLTKSSRPSGECGTCRGGQGLTGWAPRSSPPPGLSACSPSSEPAEPCMAPPGEQPADLGSSRGHLRLAPIRSPCFSEPWLFSEGLPSWRGTDGVPTSTPHLASVSFPGTWC